MGSAVATRNASRKRARSWSSAVSVKASSNWSITSSDLAVARHHRPERVDQTARPGLELVEQVRHRPRRDPKEGGLELLHRVPPGEHLGDEPALRAGQRARTDGREHAGADHRGLPAPARPDHGQEPRADTRLLEPTHDPADQPGTAEEVLRIGLPERAQALVRVPRLHGLHRRRVVTRVAVRRDPRSVRAATASRSPRAG